MRVSATVISAALLIASAGLAGAQERGAQERGAQQRGAQDRDNGAGIAFYASEDTAAAGRIADYIQTVRLAPKEPDSRPGRGVKEQAKNELTEIIAYYDAAIRHDPQDDDAYFHRGIANFYAGDRSQALADIAQASKLDPKYPYYPLWIDIIGRRADAASTLPQAIASLDMNKWPAPVIRLFLGETTPADVLAAADDPDAKTKQGQICEANFYSGELALQQGAKEQAARLFTLAAAGCPRGFVEGPAAGSELAALSGTR